MVSGRGCHPAGAFLTEGVFLIIEVPIVAGKENPGGQDFVEAYSGPGKENKVNGVKINPTDLLPADRSFYRFPGSLTTPICNEVATWYVMRNPIELSETRSPNTPSIITTPPGHFSR